jgi:riboflavin kinase/FMN adenylyltransferase
LTILKPGTTVVLLTTPTDRAVSLHELGADAVLSLRSTPSLFDLQATEFFERVLHSGLGARALVEGANFGFGRGREGDIPLLASLCRQAGMVLSVVPPVVIDGEEVSSSRIRAALLRGGVVEAERLLARPYRLRGVVGTGERRGRTIGFPTANLERVATVVPGEGVYAVRALTADGKSWAGAANIGPNPTFGDQEQKIEVHLIGFDGELYGQELRVEFVARLRDTRRFAGVGDLVDQIHRDVEQARALTG